MSRVDAYAQGFVASVFGHPAISQLSGEEKSESVP